MPGYLFGSAAVKYNGLLMQNAQRTNSSLSAHSNMLNLLSFRFVNTYTGNLFGSPLGCHRNAFILFFKGVGVDRSQKWLTLSQHLHSDVEVVMNTFIIKKCIKPSFIFLKIFLLPFPY